MLCILGVISWVGLITYSGTFLADVDEFMGGLHTGYLLAFVANLLIFTSGLIFTYRRIKGY